MCNTDEHSLIKKRLFGGNEMKGEIMIFERQLLSLTLIEKELYRLYTNLSKKIEDVAVKTLFSYIATDSLKHTNILVKIFEEVNGSKVREKHCDANILHTKKLIKKISNTVKKSELINLRDLMPLIDTFVGFENLLLNEYKKAFHLNTQLLSSPTI